MDPSQYQDKTTTHTPAEKQPVVYKTTPLRWAVLFSVASVFFIQGVAKMAFAAVAI